MLLSSNCLPPSINAASGHPCHSDAIWNIKCYSQQENKIRMYQSCNYRQQCVRHHIKHLQIQKKTIGLSSGYSKKTREFDIIWSGQTYLMDCIYDVGIVRKILYRCSHHALLPFQIILLIFQGSNDKEILFNYKSNFQSVLS